MKHGCFVVLLSLLFVSGCSKLKITTCLIDSAHESLDCSDYKKNKSVILIQDTDNYVCFSPSDARTVYETCKKAPAIITVCLLESRALKLICSTKDKMYSIIPIEDADNYVCFSPDDARTMFEYCAK